MTSTVSIIIPMYNSEKYIRDTIDSLLRQTYDNIEILIVDDGSTDSSEKIISGEYKNEVQYHYQANQGAPSARNYGLRKAKGDFIIFFDADDIMNEDAVSQLVKSIKLEQSDVSIGDYSNINTDNSIEKNGWQRKLFSPIKDSSNIHKLEKLKLVSNLNPVPGNKMYRKDFLLKNDLYFSELKISQDLNFFLKVIGNLPRISITSHDIFNYRIHNTGISKQYSDSILDVILSFKDIETINFSFFNDFPEILGTLKLNHLYFQLKKVPFIKLKEKRQFVYRELKKEILELDTELIDQKFVVADTKKLKVIMNFSAIYVSDMFIKILKLKN